MLNYGETFVCVWLWRFGLYTDRLGTGIATKNVNIPVMSKSKIVHLISHWSKILGQRSNVYGTKHGLQAKNN